MATDKHLIFVLGMHRSGTSAVTRLLNLLGAELGSNLLAAQQNVNEKGFWEHRELIDINENILGALGSAWYDFSAYPAQWWQQPFFERHKKHIKSFIDENFAYSELAALKDPRLCRLLPLWHEALQFSGKKLKSVLVLRHPDEVVASICKRDPFTRETAYLLWASYVMDAEYASRSMPRSVVQYQSILEDWQSCAKKIAGELDIRWLGWNDASIRQIDSEINPKLRHNTTRQLAEASNIERICMNAWDLLSGNQPDTAQLDIVWAELDAMLGECTLISHAALAANTKLLDTGNNLGNQVVQRDNALQDKLQQLNSLGSEHQRALKTIAERDQQIESLNQQLLTLGNSHEHALGIIQERDAQLLTLGKSHEYALGVIQERDEQLTEIGQNHEHALGVIQERDEQLEIRNRQLDKLLSNKAIRAINKMLKLTDIT